MGFDNDVAQAQHDYRYGKAQADHDLAIGDAADYAGEIAAAQIAEQSGYDLAYENFATLAMPAISEQGINDAAAEFLDRKTIDDADLYDIVHNNQAVDGYQDEESVLYAGERSADALALSHEHISDAIGHAAAIAGATLPSGGDNPWLDLAKSQAFSSSTFQITEAGALEARSVSEAGAQSTQEQAENDALEGEDDTNAQTEHDEDESQALADEQSAEARAAAADAVFSDLPDTLIDPADGPALALEPDFQTRYEANDFYLGLTLAGFGQAPSEFSQGTDVGGLTPALMPWQLAVTNAPPWWYNTDGNYGGGPDPSTWVPVNQGLNLVIAPGTVMSAPLEQTMTPDFIRGASPLTLDYDPAAHPYPQLNTLPDPTNTPSATGLGGYSRSTIPTTLTANDLADGTPPAQPVVPDANSGNSGLVQMLSDPAPGRDAKEAPAQMNRAAGEKAPPSDKTQGQLSAADKKAKRAAAAAAKQSKAEKKAGDKAIKENFDPETKNDPSFNSLAQKEDAASVLIMFGGRGEFNGKNAFNDVANASKDGSTGISNIRKKVMEDGNVVKTTSIFQSTWNGKYEARKVTDGAAALAELRRSPRRMARSTLSSWGTAMARIARLRKPARFTTASRTDLARTTWTKFVST